MAKDRSLSALLVILYAFKQIESIVFFGFYFKINNFGKMQISHMVPGACGSEMQESQSEQGHKNGTTRPKNNEFGCLLAFWGTKLENLVSRGHFQGAHFQIKI